MESGDGKVEYGYCDNLDNHIVLQKGIEIYKDCPLEDVQGIIRNLGVPNGNC
jgi:hypothetical protein